jgi:hypothetical protein
VAVGYIGPLRDDAEVLFKPTRDFVRSADVSFGQLEKCLSTRGTQQLYLNKSLGRTDPRVAGIGPAWPRSGCGPSTSSATGSRGPRRAS